MGQEAAQSLLLLSTVFWRLATCLRPASANSPTLYFLPAFLLCWRPMNSAQETHRIAVLPGDGIGPEVCEAALPIVQAAARAEGITLECTHGLVGGAAIDETGEPLPAETLELCKASSAIFFGSVGGQQWDHLPPQKRPEVGALLPLRQAFQLFANLRPAVCRPALSHLSPLREDISAGGFEIMIVRELTGDVYFGKKMEGTEVATDEMRYTKPEVERIARVAFGIARARGLPVTSVEKSNVLAASRLWKATVAAVHAAEFSDVELREMYVDNAAMQVLRRPREFGVVLTGNLFGDILSDESSAAVGSIGLSASASVGTGEPGRRFGLFEPMGGSAPKYTGQNVANPIAQILSGAMMMEHSLGCPAAAKRISDAVDAALEAGFRTKDLFANRSGETLVGTQEMGEAIASRL